MKFLTFLILLTCSLCQNEAIEAAGLAIEKLYSGGHTNSFSDDYYTKPSNEDILMNTAMLLSNSRNSIKAAKKLNGIMNKTYSGEEEVKNSLPLKSALKVILNNPFMKRETRVAAAKVTARMTGMPVTLQQTEPNVNKAPTDLSSDIIMPNKARIYEADYVANNYMAGNWGNTY
jgi:hypothetical protein